MTISVRNKFFISIASKKLFVKLEKEENYKKVLTQNAKPHREGQNHKRTYVLICDMVLP